MRFHRNGVCCFCRSRPVTSYSGWTKSMSTDSVLKKVRRPTCFSPSLSLSLSFSRARDIMHIRPSALVLSSLPFPPPFHGSSSFAPVWNVQPFCPRYNVSNGRRICILTFYEIWQSTKINVAFNDQNYRRIKGSRTAFSVTRIDSQVEARYMFHQLRYSYYVKKSSNAIYFKQMYRTKYTPWCWNIDASHWYMNFIYRNYRKF